MSNLSQFIMSGGGGKLRYQEFNSSGTFVPSAKLLANGGQCFVTLIGGGGGGGNSTYTASGGDAGQYVESVVTVVGNVTVTIGAGGLGGVNNISNGANGGNSTFGALLTAAGGKGGMTVTYQSLTRGGNGANGPGYHVTDVTNVLDARGGVGVNGKCGGGGGSTNLPDAFNAGNTRAVDGGGTGTSAFNGGDALANSGGGGGGSRQGAGYRGGNGGSGWCRVVWFE